MSNRRSYRLGLVVAAAAVMLGLSIPRLGAVPEAPEPEVHVVLKGETLWGLAKAHGPGEDPRKFVYRVRMINDLSGSDIYPGQRLLLPG